MAKISCFYNCGATGLTLENIEDHYAKFHTKLKSYYRYQDFQCDSCLNYFSRSLLYSPARSQEELNNSPHYCLSCANQNQSIKLPLKPKNMNKRKTKSKLKPRKALKAKRTLKSKTSKIKKAKSTALTLKPSKTISTPAYYNCLLNQAKTGFKGKITKACKECKTNAPALNLAYKKEAQKLVQAYKQLGVSLSKILSH
jgi:hypothetical protein